jgi:hypothetical protein
MVIKPCSRWPHLAQERAGITIAMPKLRAALDALFNKNVSAECHDETVNAA